MRVGNGVGKTPNLIPLEKAGLPSWCGDVCGEKIMAQAKREKTKYPGVTFRLKEKLDGSGSERMYYIRYRRGGRGSKLIEEPIGTESEGMTAAKANLIRAARAAGKERSNTERREDMERERLSAGSPLTVYRLWEIYSDAKQDKVTIKQMDKGLIKHLAPLHDRLIETLTTKDVDALSRRLASTPSQRREGECLSPQTIRHILALLRRMLRFADSLDICPFPAGLHFTMPKVDNQKTEHMTDEQLRLYLDALDEEPDQAVAAILRLALLTGIRKTALFSLQWSDIDFENGYITLRGEHAKKGKTEYLPLTPAARAVLKGVKRTKSPYVFPGRNGGRRSDCRRMARRVRDKAGLEDFRPMHGLRHSFASALASSGKVDLYTLQKLLTHESPQMTQRYAHLADKALRRAAGVADELLTKDKEEE